MLLTQCQGHSREGVALVGRTAGTGPVGGLKVLRLLLESLQQLAYGPWTEVECLSDGRCVLATACSVKDEATQGQGEWCRHGDPRKNDSGLTIAYPLPGRGKTFLSGLTA
jgi:hypothetical protein